MKAKLLFFVFFSYFSLLNANIVSNLEGKLSVSNGALNYAVTLNLPAGTAGVKPQLALAYNSNGANGYFGSGWNLTGLSTISRCGSSISFDGKRKAVQYDNSDNICLDGQRLVLVSGSKWANNSEYRTKIDTYSKIVYDGENFTVWTKAGDIKKYTRKQDIWLLTKISDRFNNSIVYHFSKNPDETYLENITYADNKIALHYENRMDVFNGHTRGKRKNIKLSKRVSYIEILSGGQSLRKYKISYKNQLSAIDKSILKSITECSDGECLNPMEFEYTQADGKFYKGIFQPKTKSVDAVYLDFNGDGYIDVYDDNKIAYGKGNGEFGTWVSTGLNLKNDEVKFADFDGDGDIDFIAKDINRLDTGLIYLYIKQYDYSLYINEDSTFIKTFTLTGNDVDNWKNIKLANFNSDKYVDIYLNGTIYLGNKMSEFTENKNINISANNQNIYILDINGDGYSDIYEVKSGTADSIYINNKNLKFNKIAGPDTNGNIRFADFNGDGLVDIYKTANGKSVILFNNGKNSFRSVLTTRTDKLSRVLIPIYINIDTDAKNLKLVDINGDGYIDIYVIKTGADEVWLNDGKGNFPSKSYSLSVDVPSDKLLFVDVNNDRFVDLLALDNSDILWLNNAKSIKLTSVTDSFKNKTKIEYKTLTDTSVYTKYDDATSPTIDVRPAQEVVSKVIATGSNDTKVATTYKYEGLKTNIEGLGSLGFAKIITTNTLSNIKNITIFNQSYPYTGTVSKTFSYLDDELISKSEYLYSMSLKNGIYQIRNTKQTLKTYEDGVLLKTTTILNSNFDNYGNIGKSISTIIDETTDESFIKTAKNTYTNDSSKWILSRLTSATVESEAYGDTQTRTSSFTYDGDTGILKTEIIEPLSDKWLKKSYTYDNHGNKIKESISGADITTRTTKISYDSKGKFATKITNALGHKQIRKYNADGQIVKVTDPNNLVTSFQYDNFGKKIKETNPDGTATTYKYGFDTSFPQSCYSITVKKDGTSPVKTYFSKHNQILRTQSIGFDGRVINTDKKYDNFGNAVQISSPYFEEEDKEYSYMKYDKYQRVTEVNSPAPNNERAISIKEYDGYTLIDTNAKGQVKKTTKNVLGKVVKVEEALGAYELYSYDALGNLLRTTDSMGNEIVLKYDIQGNKTYQNDPDMGEWSYTYNALGELISQRDAKGQTTYIEYDLLGRKISEQINGSVSTWEYDTTKKGKLHQERKTNFTRTYSYDNLLRLHSISTTTDAKTFTKTFTYDKYSRVATKTLPKNFIVENVYNNYGYLEAIKSPKKQIKDFDPELFATLIEKTLDDAMDSYKKSLEYQDKAKKLRAKASCYIKIAAMHDKYKQTYLNYAKTLNASASKYEYYGQKYKRYAAYYKRQADRYISLANRFSGWWGGRISTYFTRIANKYKWYSRRYAYWSNYYLNKAKKYQDLSLSYKNYATKGDYYRKLAKNAVNESKKALAIATNYSQRSKDGYEINKAYQTILDDSEYNYFYKVLQQDSYGRVTKYISGNGLITSKEYDSSGALNTIKTGYNFDDAIRELHFEYDSVFNVTSREDKKLQITQKYEYDNLNRIVAATSSTQSDYTNLSYRYDTIGNMIYKSDIGAYSYSGTSPHQVTVKRTAKIGTEK